MEKTLQACEEIIQKSEMAQLAAATALRTIREGRLYKPKYTTFEAYCQGRWGWTRQHANRLIDYAKTAAVLEPTGVKPPACERQARPLTALTSEQKQVAWQKCLEVPEAERTNKAIEQIARTVKMSPTNRKIDCVAAINQPVAKAIQPPLRWYGAKHSLASQIVSLFPDHKSYVEPFAGSLAVLFTKLPSKIEIVSDLHAGVMHFYRVLRDRDQCAELQRLLKLTPYCRDEHSFCKLNPGSTESIEKARRFYVRCRQSFGGILDETWHTCATREQTGVNANAIDDLLAIADRLRRVQIDNVDFRDIMKRTPDRDGILMYCDPPYMRHTRTKRSDGFDHEMTDDDHLDMLDRVSAYRRTNVAVSGYDSPAYNKALKKWTRREWPKRINVHTKSRDPSEAEPSERTEVLWANWS